MKERQKTLALRHDAPLVGLILESMLKDPTGFLAKEEKNKIDFIVDCEAAMMCEFIKNQQYINDLEKQKQRALEEYELYQAYLDNNKKIKQSANNDKTIVSIASAIEPYTIGTAQGIKGLMDKLLEGIANLNQIISSLSAINQQIKPTALQTYQTAQVQQMQGLLSINYQLPNGVVIALDPNSEDAIELLERAKNRLLPPELLTKSKKLKEKYGEIEKDYAEEFIKRGVNQIEAQKRAHKKANHRLAEGSKLCDDINQVAIARLLQEAAVKQNESVKFMELLDFVKNYVKNYLKNSTLTVTDIVELSQQYQQEINDFSQEDLILQRTEKRRAIEEQYHQILRLFMDYNRFTKQYDKMCQTPYTLFQAYVVQSPVIQQDAVLRNYINLLVG